MTDKTTPARTRRVWRYPAGEGAWRQEKEACVDKEHTVQEAPSAAAKTNIVPADGKLPVTLFD